MPPTSPIVNKALEGHADLAALSVEDLISHLDRVPENIRTAVRNNGGGHANHSLFWTQMKKGGGGEPKGDLASAITAGLVPSRTSRPNSGRPPPRGSGPAGPG